MEEYSLGKHHLMNVVRRLLDERGFPYTETELQHHIDMSWWKSGSEVHPKKVAKEFVKVHREDLGLDDEDYMPPGAFDIGDWREVL